MGDGVEDNFPGIVGQVARPDGYAPRVHRFIVLLLAGTLVSCAFDRDLTSIELPDGWDPLVQEFKRGASQIIGIVCVCLRCFAREDTILVLAFCYRRMHAGQQSAELLALSLTRFCMWRC